MVLSRNVGSQIAVGRVRKRGRQSIRLRSMYYLYNFRDKEKIPTAEVRHIEEALGEA
jgi:hypothetical protein